MKRILHAAGVVAAAAALCLTTATSAGAATGTLVLNGQRITNPQGCYNSDLWPMGVGNETDKAVLVFDGGDCDGQVIASLPPGRNGVFEFGASVRVP
ncbi:hypothetical protein E6W39_09745 [Kitasatospora acidiphila]|uniref:Secreted protein n=1 Tax=Kitasatospora acidiphila TaxID=2567942 RepID=A0A540W2F6_9ACTN|nr:hypothetical protein [Kitasatospora acidiphila]TQF02504.1 hypothetical protein E6W39_09745 [Kitasatospora acidiphila]